MPGRVLRLLRFGLLTRVAFAHLALNLLVVSPYLAWTFYSGEESREWLYAANALPILRWVTLPALVAVVLVLAASRGRAEHEARGLAELSVGLLGTGLSALVLWTSGLLSEGDGGFVLRVTVIFHMVAALLARVSRVVRLRARRRGAEALDDA